MSEAVEDTGDEADERLYTIDELALVSGVPSRTIRYYQSKGVLPHPDRLGRIAVYTEAHLARLKRILALQDKGLRLDAIRDVFEKMEGGDPSLQEWLGLDDHLTAAWLDDEPQVVSLEDLAERLGPDHERRLAEMTASGLVVAPDDGGDRWVITSPGLFDTSLRLSDEQVDYALQVHALEVMREALRPACVELVRFFADRAGEGFGDDVELIARQMAALRPIGGDSVRIVFGQEMQRALERFVADGGAEAFARRRAGEA